MSKLVRLHLEFVEGTPAWWRVIEVPWSTTLEELDSVIHQVFDGLADGHFSRREGVKEDKSQRVVDVYGQYGNRFDYLFDDYSNPLVIWNDGLARPTDSAYPRLVAGGRSPLDERDPEEASTFEPRELEGAERGDWQEPDAAGDGVEMVRRFLEAHDLMDSNAEAFEKLVEADPEVFEDFAWATKQISEAEDDISPRMRRPFHALKEAGIDIEVGLLDQISRAELYRSDQHAVGFYAEVLASLAAHADSDLSVDAFDALFEILKLDQDRNPVVYQHVCFAVADLDGPEYERVLARLEKEPPLVRLDILAALSHVSQQNEDLTYALFDLLDELDDEAKSFALDILGGLHGDLADHRIYQLEAEMREDQPTFQRAEPEPGRNDPCHCGSGKKYKKCCMRA